MKILGLDQASEKTGFSIFDNGELTHHGVFNVGDIDKKSYGDLYYMERVDNMLKFLDRMITDYNIDLVIIEDVQGQVNPLVFKKLSWLQGVLIHYLYNNMIAFSILKVSTWRSKTLKIKGRKREDVKANTQNFIKEKYGIETTEDEADAIGIGLAASILLAKDKLDIYQNKLY